ncbi:MAG TPA: tryptophan 2,3-dioxygenase family protein [Gemmatimonadales bacterium]|nr:tryptophan 2,3-dioxygenase family protein [Gemmatimonadales bacterium]
MSFGLPETKLTYGGYLRVRDLIALQQLKSDPPQHDEMLFIIIHQTYELWFKQVVHELDGIIRRIDEDDVLGAARLLRRCHAIERVLIDQLSVLETMTPVEFLSFRDHLMPASGFQSAQFREIEYTTGLKEPRFLSYYNEGTPERARLESRLAGRSLRDAWGDIMRRRGFAADARGVAGVYQHAGDHPDLFQLLETLIEFDELLTLWRYRHVQMVERVIGGKPGTGGSSGAEYLRGTTVNRIFPELWDARTLLGAGGHA